MFRDYGAVMGFYGTAVAWSWWIIRVQNGVLMWLLSLHSLHFHITSYCVMLVICT